jgi:hypothetical protein
MTPAVFVNGAMESTGKILSEDEIRTWIQAESQERAFHASKRKKIPC